MGACKNKKVVKSKNVEYVLCSVCVSGQKGGCCLAALSVPCFKDAATDNFLAAVSVPRLKDAQSFWPAPSVPRLKGAATSSILAALLVLPLKGAATEARAQPQSSHSSPFTGTEAATATPPPEQQQPQSQQHSRWHSSRHSPSMTTPSGPRASFWEPPGRRLSVASVM